MKPLKIIFLVTALGTTVLIAGAIVNSIKKEITEESKR